MATRRRDSLLGTTLLALMVGCGDSPSGDQVGVPGREGATKTAASVRALRRAYDGAPPVIPHDPVGAACIQCHDEDGLAVPDLGFAPPCPHEATRGLSALSNCRQCHVYQATEAVFVANQFRGVPQDLRRGKRLNEFAPPVMPHPVFMRENCHACHDGPAAREEIRCPHPERTNCRQCHVPTTSTEIFVRGPKAGF